MYNLEAGFEVAPADMGLVLGTGHVQDEAIRAYHDVLARHTPYRPRVIDYIYYPEDLPAVPLGQPHLQVIYRESLAGSLSDVGHWVTVFYDGRVLNIYDSLSYNNLSPLQTRFLQGLFPFNPPIVYKSVQQQTDSIMCGLYATAFATSIALGRDPCTDQYQVDQMRAHLARILQQRQLLHFPVTVPSVQSETHSSGKVCWSAEASKRFQDKKDAKKKLNIRKANEKQRRLRAIASKNKLVTEPQMPSFSPVSSPLTKKKCLSVPDMRPSQFHTHFNLTKPHASTDSSNVDRALEVNMPSVRTRKPRSKSTHCAIQTRQTSKILESRLSDATRKRNSRLDVCYRENEQQKNSEAKKIARNNKAYRKLEQQRDFEARRVARQDQNYRQGEQQRDSEARRLTRQDSTYRQVEQQRDSEARRLTRQDSTYRQAEQQRDSEARRLARDYEEFRLIEQQRDSEARRIARLDDDYTEQESTQRRLRDERDKADWEKVSLKFLKQINEGYSHACNCCGRLFHKKSITVLTKSSIMSSNSSLNTSFLNNVFFLNPRTNTGEFCRTCALSIRRGQVPRLACSNGLVFPPIPESLSELSPLEERLVSPRHIFLKIVRKGHGLGYQHGLAGNVINVPVEVNTMVSALPRSCSDNHVITVELKRRMCYRHGRRERVRPEKVRQAANYLVETELFKELGIVLNETWDVVEEQDENTDCTCHADSDNINDGAGEEEVEPVNPGGQETLLDNCGDVTLIMAPGDGKRPLSLIHDEHVEELGFIKVHCGKRREFKVKLSHLDITKSEISRHDRRAVRPDYLFTALKKEQILAVQNNITTCLRKKSSGGSSILAGNLLDDDFLNNLVQLDEGYRVLKSIRNSPAHWEAEKKKVLAMIRQFGVPTLFITLSAAETKWNHLLKLLKQVVDNEIISLDEAESLSYNDKARLIQSDPFICATYFEIRLQELRKTWSSSGGPFGEYKISNFYYRIEFQHRGSPHAHIILWLEGAPLFLLESTDSMLEVANFVDSIISCSSDSLDADLVALQKHKHTHTCHPKPGRPCRFDIPFFPMDRTQILVELGVDDPSYKTAGEMGDRIKNELESLPQNIESFEDFLRHYQVSFSEYLLAVRSTIKKPKLMLKRLPKDIMMNPFSKKIIELHRANMDIQFILDAFACAQYVVNYINKADRGISRLLRSVVEEVKRGNKGVKDGLRSICNVFLNASEISAQEAVYCLVGLPMSRTSESEVFINTSPPDQRVHILKGKQELAQMDPSSAEVFLPNLLDHYVNRPVNDTFNKMPLAVFSTYYTYSKKRPKAKGASNSDNLDEDSDVSTSRTVGKWIPLQKGGWIRRRSKPKILRFRNYNKHQDPDNFFREQLMLYMSWRNEEDELLNPAINLEQTFVENVNSIKEVYNSFNRIGGSDEFDRLIAAVHEAEVGVHEEGDGEDGLNMNRRPLDGFELEEQVGDVMDDIVPGGHPGPDQAGDPGAVIAQPPSVSESDLLAMTRMLNDDQRNILLHIIHHFQTASSSSSPLYVFVSGGAGVGKSVFIKTLYQCLMAYFKLEPGSNPDDLKVLLSAPTGKAAFGIGGQTIHSALGLPISQAGSIIPELSPSIANTLACKLAKLQLIVIDEISMVGSRTFNQINRRLQQLFHSSELFSGISMVVVGDLKQLPPVGDSWIFQPNSSNPLALLAGSPLWDLFKLFELKKIMRQRDDFTFAQALNNMSLGAMTEEDIALFRSRTFTSSTLPAEAEGAVHLFSSNREVDRHNELALSKFDTESAVVSALDTVSGGPNRTAQAKALQTVSSLPTTQTYGLPSSITLKVDARYMMTVNVDTSDGLVNGSTGRLKKIDFGVNRSIGERRPIRVWLELDELFAGKTKRTLLSNAELARVKTDRWTPVEPATYTVKRWKSSNLQVRRTQFPLVPAEAITIHKSQGATMDKVVVHLKPPNKRPITYVACSRARCASGLFIVADKGFEPPIPPASTNPVLLEMQKLRDFPLIPTFQFLKEPKKTQVIFHNVQSLRKHEEDVVVDPVICASHVVLLVETWSCSQDKFTMLSEKGFLQVSRTNGPQPSAANPGMGVLALVKEDLVMNGRTTLNSGRSLTSCMSNSNCEVAWVTVDSTVVMAVYRSPRCPLSSLTQLLRDAFHSLGQPLPDIVVAGDFNIDLKTPNTLVNFFLCHNLRPVLSSIVETTRSHTTIDGVFASFECEGGVYESFFSYHRPLWFRF